MVYEGFTGKDFIDVKYPIKEAIPSLLFSVQPRYQFSQDDLWDIRSGLGVSWLFNIKSNNLKIGPMLDVGYALSPDHHVLDANAGLILKYKNIFADAKAGYKFFDWDGPSFGYGLGATFNLTHSLQYSVSAGIQHDMLDPKHFALTLGVGIIWSLPDYIKSPIIKTKAPGFLKTPLKTPVRGELVEPRTVESLIFNVRPSTSSGRTGNPWGF